LFDSSTQNGKKRKQNDENDGHIENQALYTTSGFEDRTSATATEGTAEARASYLQQNKDCNGYTENNLYYSNSRKPLSQEYSSLSGLSINHTLVV